MLAEPQAGLSLHLPPRPSPPTARARVHADRVAVTALISGKVSARMLLAKSTLAVFALLVSIKRYKNAEITTGIELHTD